LSSPSSRTTMVRSTGDVNFATSDCAPYVVRKVRPDDNDLLGELLYAAYLGTIDYRNESLDDFKQELLETMFGRYGNMIWNASFVALDQDGIAVSTCLVTDNQKLGPLLAFAASLPTCQKKGLATLLIKKSLQALKAQSVSALTLVVTPGNRSAVSLYKKLGFEVQRDD
jgi:GNAT superfamily N-acetyltransferase